MAEPSERPIPSRIKTTKSVKKVKWKMQIAAKRETRIKKSESTYNYGQKTMLKVIEQGKELFIKAIN